MSICCFRGFITIVFSQMLLSVMQRVYLAVVIFLWLDFPLFNEIHIMDFRDLLDFMSSNLKTIFISLKNSILKHEIYEHSENVK